MMCVRFACKGTMLVLDLRCVKPSWVTAKCCAVRYRARTSVTGKRECGEKDSFAAYRCCMVVERDDRNRTSRWTDLDDSASDLDDSS